MERDENTRVGDHVVVFVKNVAVSFKKVNSVGITIVKELDKGPDGPNGKKILQYYKIKTTAEYDGPVKIRIVLPCNLQASELWKWLGDDKGWKRITKSYNSKYHFIVSEKLESLSIFGVT